MWAIPRSRLSTSHTIYTMKHLPPESVGSWLHQILLARVGVTALAGLPWMEGFLGRRTFSART